MHLLAFHPCREDRGPGCRANPLDAGHFSVRVLWQEGKGVIQHQRVVIFSASRSISYTGHGNFKDENDIPQSSESSWQVKNRQKNVWDWRM